MANYQVTGGVVLSGEITPSGSKNSVVSLIPTTLLFDKPVTLTNVPDITDVSRLVKILTDMGSKIDWDKENCTLLIDNSQVVYDPLTRADIGEGKGIRGTNLLWGPMLARFKKVEVAELPIGCTLGARPIDAHYQAFMDLGVSVKQLDGKIILDATKAVSGLVWLLETSVTATENAIMLAVSLPGISIITNSASEPHVQEICRFLNRAGAKITGIGSSHLTIEGGLPLSPISYNIISDIYEIGTFLALGALTGGEIRVLAALPQHSTAVNREFAKFGINIEYDGDTAIVSSGQKPVITKTKSPLIVRAQPWPALPVDMLPLFIPLALAAPSGQALFHNWMYEAGLFWTSELIKLGANIVMCDPHRVIVIAGNSLKAAQIEAPYIIRAVISLVMSAMIADGTTTIINADSIHRGHPHFAQNLRRLGAKIEEI
ncbi:MAG: EPSP synthase (3-phosphoshikimate 1-carboxyvinyltransferase) superfamily [Candidatus Amesbacteria bacterium GW2011_GWB1_48_13]|uniref:UDP-N-acetylglucosamine 1-carboxyvinyltransferase n=1 Tax=Candidatus Amesbacteria bacterium GW2011_GWB1_48_13 TaxID=1618362 RepID=A0A0G1XUE7_9BACT|nr:MAG: EPSP synthase (3-phosphoshikimate 1-carboxyvinyltransferase) superfamily [Candidatus Amesbacteria bacterium GW2011_GWB1_48_13]